MKKVILIILVMFLAACGGESEAKEGIPFEEIKETWHEKIEAFNHPLDLGELNDEYLTRIGNEPNLLFGVNDSENVTQIEILSRNGHAAENMDKMIAVMGVLIMTLDEELTTGIDDIDYIENWLVNNENKDLNEHSFRVDGDINDTHYIFAYINENKE